MSNLNKRELTNAVTFTIIYYNVLGHPPTTFEIWKHLIRYRKLKSKKYSLLEIIQALESDEIKKDFFCQDSFWSFEGYEKIIRQRVKKQKIAITKIKRLRKWVRFASFLPYSRGFFINGTLAMKRSGTQSDWDVLLVMKKGQIWLGRLLVSVFFHFSFKRRHHDKIKDRFCLNHFLAEDGLILEENNIYSANELIFSMPIYGKNVFRKFIQLNENQISKFKFNYERDELNNFFTIKEWPIAKKIKSFFEWLLDVIFFADISNWLIKRIMIKKIKNNPKTYMEGADIRYSDQALIFLPQPRREIIFNQAISLFKDKLNIGIKN